MIRTFVSLNGAKIMFFVISEKKKKKKYNILRQFLQKKGPSAMPTGPKMKKTVMNPLYLTTSLRQ